MGKTACREGLRIHQTWCQVEAQTRVKVDCPKKGRLQSREQLIVAK